MDNGCNVFTQRNNTYVSSGAHASFCNLVADTAYQCYQNTLCLIRFYQRYTFFYRRSGSQNNSNTRNVSCYKRNTQFTNSSIRQMSSQRSFVWCCTINIFQSFNKLCAQCSCYTGHERIVQTRLSCHQSFYNSQSLFQFF